MAHTTTPINPMPPLSPLIGDNSPVKSLHLREDTPENLLSQLLLGIQIQKPLSPSTTCGVTSDLLYPLPPFVFSSNRTRKSIRERRLWRQPFTGAPTCDLLDHRRNLVLPLSPPHGFNTTKPPPFFLLRLCFLPDRLQKTPNPSFVHLVVLAKRVLTLGYATIDEQRECLFIKYRLRKMKK
ncbi:unnamed protein product [Lactuca saligna]|uniref:Uncharacterized protein n=1 Tax=Lactuca saligna TaxID=75948 RepID=A0AA36A5L7_LACSI|nr:unnamed protein product [Lactuca saligna]